MDDSLTIAELAELAAEALAPGLSGGLQNEPDVEAVAEPARANGRVRDVPNERLIRWYGTVGLVDPPLSRRGRVARYGRRHLLQLVAVKRRQAEGKSLAEIQEELAGATDEALAAVARVPAPGPAVAQSRGTEPAAGSWSPARAGPARFWARQPQLAAEESPAADVETPAAGADVDGAGVPAAGIVHGIRLAPGVVLMLDGTDTEPGSQDLAAIINAARPLLRELASRGLGAPGSHYLADMDPETGAGSEH
jgi:hypothetical protein